MTRGPRVAAHGNVARWASRGAAGTVYAGYDGLDRPVWLSTNANGSGPFATYSYDSMAGATSGSGG